MSEQTSKENIDKSSNSAGAATVSSSPAYHRQRNIQNFLLIWVDINIDQLSKDCQNTLIQLRNIVNDVNIFTEPDQCIQFLNNVKNEKAFVIVSGSLGQHLVPNIHDMSQVDAIYIFCGNKSRHEQWTKNWVKIKGIHTEIKPICQALRLAAKQCNQDSIAISFVTTDEGASSKSLDQLEPSFMYTQIFKEILLEIKYDEKSIKDLASYCRKLYNGNMNELKIIDEFERDYDSKSSVWWYTRECFTYQMLNRALRTLECDTIINMGFFVHNLHRQIEELHQQQIGNYNRKPFIVYRGQGLSITDFGKLRKAKDGLMSFNSFLSTSKKHEVSLKFARDALTKTDMVGILFQMSIDPTISSTLFATIENVSYFQTEEEILFSMHTVFRIGEVKQIDSNSSFYQVELKLTGDDDPQLRSLSEYIRKEMSGSTGWSRLGRILIKLSQLDKAEEVYKILLDQPCDDGDKAASYNQLGYIKDDQGDYEKALWYYTQSLEIKQKIFPPNHRAVGTTYGNIGTVYNNMKDYSKALLFYEKSLSIFQRILSSNHPYLASIYSNIGMAYCNMGEHSKALSYYEKALEIEQKVLPSNHPSLAISYNNIAVAYTSMKQYTSALSYYEKTLGIEQKVLPSNHPSLATSYNNIASVYANMKQYAKALAFFERALNIFKDSLPANHPNIRMVQNNIDELKKKL